MRSEIRSQRSAVDSDQSAARKRQKAISGRAFSRIGRWAAAACLLVLSATWPSPAQAATPAWWDCNYGYRKQITVTAGTSVVPNGYSVSLTFNHQALVPAKSLASGNDVRVLWWSGAAWVELDRVLDQASSWNNATTKIWFKTMASISASGSDTNYYLYYGNPGAGTPPANGSNSLVFSEGFESGNLNGWSGNSNGWGSAGDVIAAVTGGEPKHTGSWSGKATTDTDGSVGSEADVFQDFADQNTLTATVWVYLASGFPGAGTDYITLMRFVDNTPGWKNIITTTIDQDRSLYLWNDSCSGDGTCEAYGYQAPGRTILNTQQWYKIEMQATINGSSGEARLWIDGNIEITATGKNLGTNLINRYTAGISWTAPYNASNTLYIDDVQLRGWLPSEPTTSLGSELAQDCPPPGSSLCNWQYKRKLTFNNSAQAENLIDFPVLVVLNSSRIDYGQTQNGGQDLRFTDADGVTLLAHEIEKWDEAGTSYVWVKVPQIDASSSTDHIWMYYGNASAPDGQNKTAVWDGNFKMVHHLKETSGPHRDSTSNVNDSVAISVAAQGTAAGQINGADDFTASSNHYVQIADSATLDVAAGESITVEAWMRPTLTGAYQEIVSKDSTTGGTGGWDLILWNTNAVRFAVYDEQTDVTSAMGGSVSANTWYYVVGRWTQSSTTVQVFLNGSSVASTVDSTQTLGFSNSNPVKIGDDPTSPGSYDFTGRIDEVRVSKTARSNAWISAQHKSMTDVFITYGAQESNGTSVTYFAPDAAAAVMNIPMTFVGSICQVPATFTTSSSDIVVGPSIMTDANGAVVTQNGSALSTVFFVKPDARPATGITVTVDGKTLSQTFDIVMPTPDPNVASGTVSLSNRTKRGTKVLGGLTVSGGTLTIDTSDTDGATVGNQGYLPSVILVKGDVNIAGTIDIKGQNGTNGGSTCTGGDGGTGGPGGGGGGGGGVKDATCGAGGGGTIDKRVSTSSDDAEQCLANSAMDLTSSDLELIADGNCSGSNQQVGMRFQAMTVPQGATITNAYIVFTAETPRSGSTSLNFYGQAIDNAPTFTTSSGNITSRTKTSASVAWNNIPAWNTDGQTHQTPNLSSVIQEIVNRAGWVSGNSLVIIVTGSGNREAYSYDGGSTKAALLHVEYDQGSPSSAAPGGSGMSGGGGGGAKGSGTGGAGGGGTGAVGGAASGTTGGAGGVALSGATAAGGGMANTEVGAGDGGGGGTGDPLGTGGSGATTDGALGGKGGGGGGASGGSPGGGGGGGFAIAGGSLNATEGDAGFGGSVSGNAQLVPLAGGSGGAGGGPDMDITTANRGGGGGGGGGAVLIYATGSVTVSGTITAVGGNGGNGYTSGGAGGAGGGGSGGAIFLQSGTVTTTGTLTTAAGTGGGTGSVAGGAGGTGRIRIDGLATGSTVPGTAGSKFIGPVVDTLVGTTVNGRADGGSTVTLYVYDSTGAQVTGSPYTTSAGGSSGSVGTWTITNVTFPSGTGYLAVKQSSGSYAVLGPGRATKGLHLTNWREVY